MSLLVDWSDINTELLDLIMKRLDLIEFIRAGAVCRSWRSTMKTCRYISPPKSHTPWLILSSPHQPDFRYVSNPAADSKSLYKFNLPNLKYHYIVGSSHGFIISVDEICQLHATNPITGSHRLLPAITTLPCCEGAVLDPIIEPVIQWDVDHARRYFCKKVAFFPTSSSAGLISVLIHRCTQELAFARQSDESWTHIQSPLFYFEDVLFYKSLLYAVDYKGCLLSFDILNYSASSQPVIHQVRWPERFDYCCDIKYLVQSPCGSDLFLISRFVVWMRADDDYATQTKSFKIYKLNQDCYQWSEVSSFGTDPVVVFLGFSPSVMLLAKDIPNSAVNKGDSIYFTDDSFCLSVQRMQNTLDMGIFYLEDNKIIPLDITKDHPQQFNHPRPFWLTPINK